MLPPPQHSRDSRGPHNNYQNYGPPRSGQSGNHYEQNSSNPRYTSYSQYTPHSNDPSHFQQPSHHQQQPYHHHQPQQFHQQPPSYHHQHSHPHHQQQHHQQQQSHQHPRGSHAPPPPHVLPYPIPDEIYEAIHMRLSIDTLKTKLQSISDSKLSSCLDRLEKKREDLLREVQLKIQNKFIPQKTSSRVRDAKIAQPSRPRKTLNIGGVLVNPKFTKKVYVPVKQFPNYNFIGLILGPRGKTHQLLERESGAKVAIRGKGSVPPERIRLNPALQSDDDLHVLIEGDTEESVQKAAEMVNKLLIPLEEGKNEIKRQQLRELAKIHGTLRHEQDEGENIFEGKVSLNDTLRGVGKDRPGKTARRNKKGVANSEDEMVDTEMQAFLNHLTGSDSSALLDQDEMTDGDNALRVDRESLARDAISLQPPAPGTEMESDPIYLMFDKYYIQTKKEVEKLFETRTEQDVYMDYFPAGFDHSEIPGVDFEEDHRIREIILHTSSTTQKNRLEQEGTGGVYFPQLHSQPRISMYRSSEKEEDSFRKHARSSSIDSSQQSRKRIRA